MPLTIILLIAHIPWVIGAPVSQVNIPSEKTVGLANFMKQYGYIAAGPDVDVLIDKEEGFAEAVKLMQKFGGLPQTGELDNDTLQLTTAARCGVPDIIKEHSNRKKRYIIGSQSWKKRTLTYFLANWPPELDPETTAAKLKQAFEMWSNITPLKFVPREGMDADLIVAFGRGPHGDGYPFDGPGSILAHAFFPYEHGSYGGDLHFDDDEHWIDGALAKDPYEEREGVDFFTVATHEIGHSLGLAHSAVPGSIMFPYYKGYNKHMRMDYDDIVAMYDMYVVREKFEDEPQHRTTETYSEEYTPVDEGENIPVTVPYTTEEPLTSPLPTEEEEHENSNDDRGSTEVTTDIPLKDHTSFEEDISTAGYKEVPKENDTNKEEEIPKGDGFPVNRTEKEKPRKKIPDLCEGFLDAAAMIRNEIFIFKGLYVWRMTELGKLAPGYPVHFHIFFRGFPWSIRKIDALYQRPDYNILFFTGQQYWVFDGNEFTKDSPKSLTDLGLPPDLTHLDAALVWAKNRKTYFFSNDLYWRFDDTLGKVEEKYPQRLYRWKGVPSNVDAAFTWKDGQTYFFKDKQFWRFNNQNISTDASFPLPTAPYWFHCPHEFF